MNWCNEIVVASDTKLYSPRDESEEGRPRFTWVAATLLYHAAAVAEALCLYHVTSPRHLGFVMGHFRNHSPRELKHSPFPTFAIDIKNSSACLGARGDARLILG
jgi:hypothetical protein